ncbi:MAG TPA: PQQ-binding-like beta-propeller repeat protein [Gemmataceae bacterium]|nr:PQQ-binding-like beta-propeller repeat protein [Gemmataceae bacterium]
MSPLRTLFAATLFIVAGLSLAIARGESNWPRWRGPRQDGHTAETNLPVKWTSADLAWKTPLPGIGQSSPIIWGDRILLTAALEKGKERIVFCVDRNSGKIVWQHSAWKGQPEPSHILNGWASASCVTDGEVVVAFFGRGGLHAYTVDGKHLWSRDLGPFEGPWGTAASPIMVDDVVIQNCDSDENAYLIALDKRTGKEIWRTRRRNYRGWNTPIVVNAGRRRELVVNGHEGVQAYDPATGRELWFCKSAVGRGEPTITPAGDALCVVNGLTGGEIYCVRPGGSGDVTESHMTWHTPRRGARDTPSPIVVGDYVMVCDMKGLATCYSANDGHIYWKERLSGEYSSSPIAANGLVYVTNEAGKTLVIKPGPSLEIVAENELIAGKDEIFRASPTPCDGQIFLRSTTVLYCLGRR